MSDIPNNYIETKQLSQGVYVVEDGNKSWGGKLNTNFELLNELLKTKTLTIIYNGNPIGYFDNTQDKSIIIPKDDHVLTLSVNGNYVGSFNNSEDKDFNIEIEEPQYGTLQILKNGENIGSFDCQNNSEIDISVNEFEPGNLIFKVNGEQIGYYSANNDSEINIEVASEANITDLF